MPVLSVGQGISRAFGLVNDVRAQFRPPIFVAGLARSGTSWLAEVLSTAGSLRYVREPFNPRWNPEAESLHLRYLPAGDAEERLDVLLKKVERGRGVVERTNRSYWPRYQRYPRWPGRTLVKDVHTVLALERV